VIGPLPALHRVLLAAVAVLTFAVGGAWVALTTPYLVRTWGLLAGAATGTLVAYLLVHDFHRGAARPARAYRR